MTTAKLKQALLNLTPRMGSFGRWFRRAFAFNRRYGVRYAGDREMSGFFTQRHAEAWLRDRHLTGVVYHYEPLDLRVVGVDSYGNALADRTEREHYVP